MFTNKKDLLEFNGISPQKIQFICLLFLGIADFLLVTMYPLRPWLGDFMVQTYLVIPALLFLGVSLTQKLSRGGAADLALGAAMILWMAFCQCVQCLNWENLENPTLFWPIYLLAFPFAAVMDDGEAHKGLRLMALISVILSMVMTLCSIMLILDILPPFWSETVIWDAEGRLVALGHPNISGWEFMIGIAFTLCFAMEAKKKWAKGLLFTAAALQLTMQALTNSRTTNLLTCGLIAMIALSPFSRVGWKRILLCLMAAAAVTLCLFKTSSAAYNWNHDRLLAAAIAQQEEEMRAEAEETASEQDEAPEAWDEETWAGQEEETWEEDAWEDDWEETDDWVEAPIGTRNGFFKDLRTLTGRTGIWRGAFNTLRNHPEYLLRGTAQVGSTAKEGGNPFGVLHLHNSWVEILVGFGIPGLLLALYFTFLSLRGACWVLFVKHGTVWQQCTATLMLCMLVAGLLEPYLYIGYTYCHIMTTISMVCTGYLNHWYRTRR